MPRLRQVATGWIAFVAGIAGATAHVTLVPPASSRVVDGGVTLVCFAVGASIGAWAALRVAPRRKPIGERRASPAPSPGRVFRFAAVLVPTAFSAVAVAYLLSPTMSADPSSAQLVRLSAVLAVPLAAVALGHYPDRRRTVGAPRPVRRDEGTPAHSLLGNAELAIRSIHTPATNIRALTHLLVDSDGTDPEAFHELLPAIHKDASQISRVVENLVATSRMESRGLAIDQASVDLAEIVNAKVRQSDRRDKSVQVHGSSVFARADASLLALVVENLLDNALTHGGQRIDLVVASESPRATVTVADDGHWPTTSHKLPQESAAADTDAIRPHHGLGLEVVEGLVEAMGGTVAYVRRLGWTNVVVSLPEAAKQTLDSGRDTRDAHEPPELRLEADDGHESRLVGPAGTDAVVYFAPTVG